MSTDGDAGLLFFFFFKHTFCHHLLLIVCVKILIYSGFKRLVVILVGVVLRGVNMHFFVTIFNRHLVHWRIFMASGHLIVLKINSGTHVRRD